MRTKRLFRLLMMLVACVAMGSAAQAEERTPAFPGAEGYGRYTTGGRGGKVYHVVNLNDSGTGSLRWALSQPGPRTIVFDVDGNISLQSELQIPGNTTIAGQTAPGMGVCVTGYPFLIKGSNVIVRYLRIRPGNLNVTGQEQSLDSWDGFGSLDHRDIIIDHCSVSWSLDECLSVCGCVNTTVQWSIVAQSLVGAGHSKGNHGYGGNWGGSGASYHHNLMAHHTSRAPRLGPRYTTQLDERVDMRNNVIYNWSGEGCYGGEAMKANIVNNYYKPGPGTNAKYAGRPKAKRIFAPGIRTTSYVNSYPAYEPTLHVFGLYYIAGNENSDYAEVAADNWANGVYNQVDASSWDGLYNTNTRGNLKASEPVAFVHTTTHSATQAYSLVTQYAGACKGGWDALDEQFVGDTKNGGASATGEGLDPGFVNGQEDNAAIVARFGSSLPTLTAGTAKADSDGDGMPDEWETANGLNPGNAADGNLVNAEGYTNLEVYMNSLVADITAQCTTGTVEGQEDVPASAYDQQQGGGLTSYSIVSDDEHVGPGLSITDVDGITLTFSETITDWVVKGSGNDKKTVDGVELTGKYAQSSDTNGASIFLATTKAGTLTIFLGGGVATSKKIVMTDGEAGLACKVLTTGDVVESNTNPAKEIAAWDGLVYDLEANKTYEFKITGTKWRMAGFRYVDNPSAIAGLKTDRQQGAVYTLQGIRVVSPQKGVYIQNGKKRVIR